MSRVVPDIACLLHGVICLQQGFRRVDFDYIVGAARLSKEAGCRHFHLLSSQGADAHSMFLYTKVKVRIVCSWAERGDKRARVCVQGQTETALTQMSFERLSIYRPA